MISSRFVGALAASFVLGWLLSQSPAQAPAPSAAEPDTGARGSLVEDRAARKLLEAGDARLEADETTKALEIWQSVIERYPRSKLRFEAHMRLGNYLLDRDRAYDRARGHFEVVALEENRDEEQRAEATSKVGICYYEARNFGKSFGVMRDVIEKFPVSPQVNVAYYYIGLGHFELGHYSRAIEALERVGTALSGETGAVTKVKAGKRLFLKIEDADLAALEPGQTIKARCETTHGDVEDVPCHQVGRNVRVVLGSVLTSLGKARPGNGILEVKGDDQVTVTYTDAHTADQSFNRKVLQKVEVVSEGIVEIVDGAFRERLQGVVLGRGVNLQITDLDRDLTDGAEQVKALVEIYREKSAEELDAEAAQAATKKDTTPGAPAPELPTVVDEEEEQAKRLKLVDRLEVLLVETPVVRTGPSLPAEEATGQPGASPMPVPAANPAGSPAANPAVSAEPGAKSEPGSSSESTPKNGEGTTVPAEDDKSIHTGIFRVTLPLEKAEGTKAGDDALQALPNDWMQITYLDERHSGEGIRTVIAKARCVDGVLTGVRVTQTEISDQELKIKTQLKTASALTNIGNRYKEFGLKKNAETKYEQALTVCQEILDDARRLGGRLLEETYVQLWQIYYEMDRLELAAAMCQRLQREFPNSEFVDAALLQMADVVRKQGDLQRAIGLYGRLIAMKESQLRGEAQFGIAECYETMALQSAEKNPMSPGLAQMRDRAFQEYKRVFEAYPTSGRVGEAVAKMANHYYEQKDFVRAVDIFETVLGEHPDAKFLDVILFNYGRCLYRMDRRAEARAMFDQLIGDFPESPLASDAKKISDALRAAGF